MCVQLAVVACQLADQQVIIFATHADVQSGSHRSEAILLHTIFSEHLAVEVFVAMTSKPVAMVVFLNGSMFCVLNGMASSMVRTA